MTSAGAALDTARDAARRDGVDADRRRADLRHCRAVLREHARSFAFAARFLPRDLRDDTAVVYAYYRTLDDLVDRAGAGADAVALAGVLDGWEAWLLAGLPADDSSPVRRLLPGVVARRGIDPADLAILVAGQRSDLRHERPRSLDELDLYCFRVAGSVGLVMAALLGADASAGAREAASALGSAMQLTNICRDVAEDLDRGRIYLPVDVCAVHGLDESTLRQRRSTPAMQAVIAELAARAHARYAQGVAGLHHLPPRARFPIAVAARAYGGILDALAARGYDPMAGRVATTRAQRWAMAGRLAAGRMRLRRGAGGHRRSAADR